MGYAGERMLLNQVGACDFSRAHAIVVSGDGPNVCGHMLLNTGGRGGMYFHVSEVYDYPKYMVEEGYQCYLRENEKEELGRFWVKLTDPEASRAKLEELLTEKWLWAVLPNNCVAFVETVFQAGGADFSSSTNCPAVLPAQRQLEDFVRELKRRTSDEALMRWFTSGQTL